MRHMADIPRLGRLSVTEHVWVHDDDLDNAGDKCEQ